MEGCRGTTRNDLPAMTALARSAVEELRPTRGGELCLLRHGSGESIERRLELAVGDTSVRTVVGTIDDVVVGYAVCHTERLVDGSTLAVVDDLFVDIDARGVAVGETMMNDLLAWAGRQGARGIDAMALPGNRATKNFFESFGLVARAILVHREIGANPVGVPPR